ncbi:MAG: hypothetical protein AB8H86_34120 [Polyangiales bacterium]
MNIPRRIAFANPLLVLTWMLLPPAQSHAFFPEGPAVFCETYPNAPACINATTTCLMCHTAPPRMNAFGRQLRSELPRGVREDGLGVALASVEEMDADEDGLSNVDEITLGTFPGDALSTHVAVEPSPEAGRSTFYSLGQYDDAFALRRIMVAFCGVDASYDQVQALVESTDARALLHETLTECLASSYWQREAIPRLADAKIRPLVSLGTCENMIADFEYDYRLFRYAMTNGRDARDLLTASYHVEESAPGVLRIIDESSGPVLGMASRAGVQCATPFRGSPADGSAQPLSPGHRAGMLTTQWFLVIQTQASYLPRTTAAAAYNNWLGFDISRFEGMFPIVGEPRDIDDIDIDGAPCYQCHSTLDPLAYSFAYYNGVGFEGIPGISAPSLGTYSRDRPTSFFGGPAVARESWQAEPPAAYILGEEVPAESTMGESTGLVYMAQQMSSSHAFAATLSELIWTLATGQPLGPGEHQEFGLVTQEFRDSGYSADALAHAIIDTSAFGAP